MTYILTPTALVREDKVTYVDLTRVEEAVIKVHYDGRVEEVTGPQAIDILMQLRPTALEGKRLRWAKNAWAAHNLVGHPVMQVLAFLRLYKAAMWVHDVTVPNPVVK
jgi:hypothetical protein